MIVSNNSLLNILTANENKVLKGVLKEADVKTLNSMKSANQTVGDIIKDLFSDLKSGDKNKSTIENMLKNSNLFKDLGSFSKSTTTLLNQIDTDSNLSKYKPLLQNFIKDITTMDDKSLKDLISKSGVFLESKALDKLKTNTTLPKNIETILNQIKTILKDIPGIEAKKIESAIDKILQNKQPTSTSTLTSTSSLNSTLEKSNKDLKNLVSLLQNLSKNIGDKQVTSLSTLTNSLKSISKEAQLVESKVLNTTTQTQQQTNTLENLPKAKENINSKTFQILTQLKTEVLLNKSIPNNQTIVKQIDSLIQSKDLFASSKTQLEPKALLTQLTNLNEIKTASSQNSNISTLVTNIKNQVDNITQLESKVLQNQNITNEKTQLTQDIKQTLTSLQNELVNIKNVDAKGINQIIDKLLNLQNLFSKIEIPLDLKNISQNLLNQSTNLNNFQSNFSSNLNSLILTLKESITNLTSNQNSISLQQNIMKTVEKLEGIVNNFIQNPNIIDKNVSQNHLQNDMKTVLLQLQSEFASKLDPTSQETSKNIDKMLTQIEYHQLLSIASNSNSVYIPFLWDMLDEGTISMKKINEDKFYCEINLSLKEFGETQLLLALYDKNKLDLTIYASKDSFKQSIKENSIKLKQALNSVDLIPVNINIIDLKKDDEKPKETEKNNFYKPNVDLGLGINIKV